ncbi:hypothetical protein [Rhodopila sp.]|uniref:hypothetical protein n=1 Tax=Rhodopila sp. TaxID=2480087 RepID=UPI003D10F264
MLAVLADKLTATRSDCAPLAGKSTLNRLEFSRPGCRRLGLPSLAQRPATEGFQPIRRASKAVQQRHVGNVGNAWLRGNGSEGA